MIKTINGAILLALVLVLVMLLQACVATRENMSESLIGRWQSDLGGFQIFVEYGESTVKVGDHEAVNYVLKGNELRIADGGSEMRVVSFPTRNKMILVDPVTGTRQEFNRLISQ